VGINVTAIQFFRSADTGRMNIKHNISGAQRPGREVRHSGIFKSELKMDGSISTPRDVFMA
jgi:hypothetical protein